MTIIVIITQPLENAVLWRKLHIFCAFSWAFSKNPTSFSGRELWLVEVCCSETSILHLLKNNLCGSNAWWCSGHDLGVGVKMFFSEEEAKSLLKGRVWIAFIGGGFHLFSPVEPDPNSQPCFFWDQKHNGLLEAEETPGKVSFHAFSVLLLFMIFLNCSYWPLLEFRYWASWALVWLVQLLCLRILGGV